jgi:hypothetical protein
MKHGLMMKAAVLVACGALVAALGGPGCETLGLGGGGNGGYGGGGYGGGGYGGGGNPFTDVDPQEFADASQKASAISYYLAGLIASSGLDPNTVDDAALEALMQQDAPDAETAVDQWLATLDPSTMPLVEKRPRYECTDELACPYRTKCINAPYNGLKHDCFVYDCGSAKCTDCPNWWPDFLKTLLWKSWCAYYCVESGVPYPKIVAVGAGAVTHFGDKAVGPWCFAPPP